MRLISVVFLLLASVNSLVAHGSFARTVSPAAGILVRMGPAKDGPFTPIVLAAKVVLGEKVSDLLLTAYPGGRRTG